MSDSISVIIVDDSELSRLGLRQMLKLAPRVGDVREASDSKKMFELLKEEEPDLIFMDVNLENEKGVEVTEKVLEKVPDTYIIAITASKDIQDFIEMVQAGVSGFILKNITHEELIKAIDDILAGGTYYSKEFLSVARKLAPRRLKRNTIKLTDREKDVLKNICLGLSNQEIAVKLNLSSHTIDAYRKKLLSKIGAKNTASMITISIRDGLIDMDE